MDKKIKVLPFLHDLKNISKTIYFFNLAFIIILIYQYVFLDGIRSDFTQLMKPIFLLFSIGFIFFINPIYSEIIETKSNETILSLPIGNFNFLFYRVIRLFLFYSIVVILMYSSIYFNTSIINFDGEFYDVFFIIGVSMFLSALGLCFMLLGKHQAWGYSIPVFLYFYSYFYRGTGLLYWHVCQWINPKPYFSETWKIKLTIWISGIFLYFISSIILTKKEYLIN